ncbi:MAG: tetratricopeptide repeat protein [Phycisphaerae bacterium]
MSKLSILPIRATLAGRWQIPTLIVGLCLFSSGLIRIAAAHETVTFEQHVERVHALQEAGTLTRATAYLLYLLKDQERPASERGELHRLLVGTIHLAESRFQKHKPENRRAIIQNFNMAVRYGAVPLTADWIALGAAFQWSDRSQDAIDAYRQALRLNPARADRIHRRLFALQTQPGASLSAAALAELDAILEDAAASPGNYRWALEKIVERQIERGETAEAKALIEKGRDRLSGTGERPALDYSEALCLEREGRGIEAEAILRSLRDHWGVHDELWGKVGWLLGRLQQQDGRPQAALSFYEEVLDAFQGGDLHAISELGRAECLVMLDRHTRALEVFDRLKRGLLGRTAATALDRDAIRTEMTTIGESRIHAGAGELGVRYLESAMELADPSNLRQRASYVDRIAGALVRIARETQTGDDSAESAKKAQALFERAAEMYLSLADIEPFDVDASTRALRLASDNFDAAGRIERVIEVLTRFVREYPKHRDRASALLRLGRSMEALGDLPGAIESYESLIQSYPRWREALAAIVPLAGCLLDSGGEQAARGEALLIEIVDDRGRDPLFTPQAREYREALILLGRYYGRVSETAAPGHYEKAITRLEDAIALYPDDPSIPNMRFLLAESYRQSARLILDAPEARGDASTQAEARRRLSAALLNYRVVKDLLARQDATSLTELEKSTLRASYLYVGDCLFDLNELPHAIEAYREAAWRFENEPAAVSASMQVVHCYQRLGDTEEAAAALARLQWLLKKIPDSAFDTRRGMSPKTYWVEMAKRVKRAAAY